MSDKLEIRRRNSTDLTSPSGVFASEDIAEGEKIFHIPRHAYLAVPEGKATLPDYYLNNVADESIEEDEDAAMKAYYANTCLLSKQLIQELRTFRESPESSDFAPYLRYLEETQPMGQLPATYSTRAKEVLRKIQGIEGVERISVHYGSSPLPPEGLVDWIDDKFVQVGCLSADDAQAYHAVALAVQRGFDLELIPIWVSHAGRFVHFGNGTDNSNLTHQRSKMETRIWSTMMFWSD